MTTSTTLHPYFEPATLAQIWDLREQALHEACVELTEQMLDAVGAAEPIDEPPRSDPFDRVVALLQEVRDDQRALRQEFTRLLAIIVDEP